MCWLLLSDLNQIPPPNIKFHKSAICDFELLHVDGCVGMEKLYASLYLSVANIPQR